MFRTLLWPVVVILLNVLVAAGWCGELAVVLPQGMQAAAGKAGEVTGKAEDGKVVFDKLPARPTHGEITLRDGTRLVGVDLSWYSSAKPGDGPLSEDDRKEIEQILTVPSFYDKVKILSVQGDNQHVTALIELIRDREFYASKGVDIVWRIELWYFEFQNGGWAKVSQENKVVDRQRFHGKEAFEKYVNAVRWVPKIGLLKDGGAETITLQTDDLITSSTISAGRTRQ